MFNCSFPLSIYMEAYFISFRSGTSQPGFMVFIYRYNFKKDFSVSSITFMFSFCRTNIPLLITLPERDFYKKNYPNKNSHLIFYAIISAQFKIASLNTGILEKPVVIIKKLLAFVI